MGFLGDASGKESACRFKRLETQVHSLGWEDSLVKAMATGLVSCLENAMDRGSWKAMVHRVAKRQMGDPRCLMGSTLL